MNSDGTDYEPESLRVMIACLDRHGAWSNLQYPQRFEISHKILQGKMIEPRKYGKGKQKMKKDVITEEELLWE